MTANAGTPRGLEGVVAARTRMSHVDGLNGVLIIGGYSVEELAAHAGLEAAAHLLWRGRLPDRVEPNCKWLREDCTCERQVIGKRHDLLSGHNDAL